MKAHIEAAVIGSTKSVLGLKADAVGRIGKNKTHHKDISVTEEMQAYFTKLKELVPFMPKNRKLSKLEIIQYVIDYICDLQLALEAHPAGSPRPNLTGISPVSPNRQPLGVIANVPPNTTLSNTCAAQEANHDKLPAHLEEINTRPVSC